MRCPKYWSFSFSINHFNEYSGLMSFKIGVGLYLYKFPHKDCFCYVLEILKIVFLFSLVTKYVLISSLISSSTHWFFSQHVVWSPSICFPHFYSYNLFLALYHCDWERSSIYSIIFNQLVLILCLSMYSILENIPCALEKNVYCAIWGQNVLQISIKSSGLM